MMQAIQIAEQENKKTKNKENPICTVMGCNNIHKDGSFKDDLCDIGDCEKCQAT